MAISSSYSENSFLPMYLFFPSLTIHWNYSNFFRAESAGEEERTCSGGCWYLSHEFEAESREALEETGICAR